MSVSVVAPHGLHSNRAPAARAGEEEGASFQNARGNPAPCSSVATRELGTSPFGPSNAEGERARRGPAAESAWVGLLMLFDLLMPTRPQLAERSRGGADGSASVEVEGSPPSTLGLGGHATHRRGPSPLPRRTAWRDRGRGARAPRRGRRRRQRLRVSDDPRAVAAVADKVDFCHLGEWHGRRGRRRRNSHRNGGGAVS